MKTIIQSILVQFLAVCSIAAEPSFQIDADLSGGNVRVVRQEEGVFTLEPDLRDTQDWWFHFHFRLRGPVGEAVTIRFEGRNPIGVLGPAVSVDEGRSWKWLGAEAVQASKSNGKSSWSFQAVVPHGAAEARFAFAPVYLESHLREWLEQHSPNPALQVAELCRSRKGRGVELIRAGCLDPSKARGIILLSSRHHACESMASHTMEGLLASALGDDDLGRRWRENWLILALPFADKDGVEEGDQGKNRRPHDHNRDYNTVPLYPEIAAWMQLGESLKKKVVFSLDLHCPYIRGTWNDRVYIAGSAAPAWESKQRAFAGELEKVRRGPLPFTASQGYLPFGEAWNTGANYTAGRSNGRWSEETFANARFAGTLEIPYAEVLGVEVNADSARAFGRDLALAILQYLDR
jgi:hypothetical protein